MKNIGECNKHYGQPFINCPKCAADKIEEANKAKESANYLIGKYKQIQMVSLTDAQAACCALVGCKQIIWVLDNNKSINFCDIINRNKKHWENVKKELEGILVQ